MNPTALRASTTVHLTGEPWASLIPVVGERAAIVFAHALAQAGECAPSVRHAAAQLRRLGVEPSTFTPTVQEEALISLAHEYVIGPARVSVAVLGHLRRFFDDAALGEIFTCAGTLVAGSREHARVPDARIVLPATVPRWLCGNTDRR